MSTNTKSIDGIPTLVLRDGITASYRPVSGPRSRDIAQEAYDDAIEYLKKELRGNDKAHQLLQVGTSIHDIRDIVERAEVKYRESPNKGKGVRCWLRRFSATTMYYGKVLDMLAQHHPEYVALAWGTVKLVLTGILNHATLVSQLSQALAKIGEALQQTKLSAELYQTDNMREAIARLYAHILLFFQQAVRWYTMGPAGRAFSSIFKPFDLDYKDTVEQIKLCSQTVNDIANASSRAEIRDIHITIQMQNRQLQERDKKLHEMQLQLKEIQSKIDSSTSQVLQVATIKQNICWAPCRRPSLGNTLYLKCQNHLRSDGFWCYTSSPFSKS